MNSKRLWILLLLALAAAGCTPYLPVYGAEEHSLFLPIVFKQPTPTATPTPTSTPTPTPTATTAPWAWEIGAMARDLGTGGPLSGVDFEFRYFLENSWMRYGQAQTGTDGRVQWNPAEPWWAEGPDGTGRWDLQVSIFAAPAGCSSEYATSDCGGTNCSGYNCYNDRLYFWDVSVAGETYTENYFDFFCPTSTPTATSTPTPTSTPTSTPTPIPGLDEYEPDDEIPKPIAIGETQTHNLHPEGDVDKVWFGVKEGRLYALGTYGLALGTDTVITVTVNGNTCPETDYYRCLSDDIGPGFLESEVRFVPDADGSAVATIGKGLSGYYGDDKTYSLSLDLLSVDVDKYEPDEIRPKPIDDREPHSHNFYPYSDEDFVKFPVKGGRCYGVFTSGLAPSVDTKLEVRMDGALMGDNDDYDPGSGNFASTVCFLAPSSGVPTVKITNLDQFGATKTYTVTVVEEPFIDTEPDSLTFTGTGVQTLNVAVPGGGNLFWMASENGAWLDIGPATGKTPSTMNVIVTTALPTGYYAATITIVPVGAPCDSSMPRTVPVNLVIPPPP